MSLRRICGLVVGVGGCGGLHGGYEARARYGRPRHAGCRSSRVIWSSISAEPARVVIR